jgi:HSP20 family molecular chaperone IbpA
LLVEAQFCNNIVPSAVPPNNPDFIPSSYFMNNQTAMLAQQRPQTAQQRPQTVREQQLRRQQQQTQQESGAQSREKVPNPPAELSENYEWMRLTVDLPGVQLKDLDVNINHGVLTIEGVRRTMTVDGSVCVKKQKVSRRYAIDTDVVDMQKVAANLKFGVLTIKAPKKSKPNRVRVAVTEEDDEGVSINPNITVSTQPNTVSTQPPPNMNVAPVTTTVSMQPNMNVAPVTNTVSMQPNMSVAPVTNTVSTQPDMSLAPVTTTVSTQPDISVAPVTTTVTMQPNMSLATVTTTPQAPAPLTSDEEALAALAMFPNPQSFTSTSTTPQGTIVKEEHGVVQPDHLINDSGTESRERIHAYEKI